MRPAKGPLSKLSRDDFDAFTWTLGQMVFGMVPASAFARHKSPFDTIRDYMDIQDVPQVTRLAKEYLKDLCSRQLNTEQLCEKWFGKDAAGVAADVAESLDEDT